MKVLHLLDDKLKMLFQMFLSANVFLEKADWRDTIRPDDSI